jgi:hypothetical protein
MSKIKCQEISQSYKDLQRLRREFSDLAKHVWGGENKKKGVAKIYEIQQVMRKMRQELAEWRKIWEAERMKMVDYNGKKIRNFEKMAVEKIWQKVLMQTPKRNRKTGKTRTELELRFERGISIENGKVVGFDHISKNFRVIPEELYEFTDLRDLSLYSNAKLIGSLDLKHFPALESLSVSGTKISELKNLVKCINLRRLFFYDSEVAELPGVAALQNLERIEARGSLLKTLHGLEKLPSLRYLDVNDCPFDHQKEAALVESFQNRILSQHFTFRI